MLLKIWKKAKQLCKEEIDLNRDLRRVRKMSLDYDALQNIVNNVANAPVGIEINIKTQDGMDITIKPALKNEVPYQSFYDKYTKQHNG